MTSPDYDDKDNIFSDDYLTDSMFDEEDDEIGIDFHEMDLGDPAKAKAEMKRYKEQPHLEGMELNRGGTSNKKKKKRAVGKLTSKMKSKGYLTVVIETAD